MSTLKHLKVQADPEHFGQHPYHESRYVTTEDAQFERGEGYLTSGSIIAVMRDHEHQKEYALLFAAAPQLLAACQTMLAYIDGNRSVSDCQEQLRLAIGNATIVPEAASARRHVTIDVRGGVAYLRGEVPGVTVEIIDHDSREDAYHQQNQ